MFQLINIHVSSYEKCNVCVIAKKMLSAHSCSSVQL